MLLWTELLELLQGALFVLTQLWGGSLGSAILTLPLLLRLLLLPLNLRLAQAARLRQQRMAELAPELERLRNRHGRQPERLASETERLFRERGLSLLDSRSLLLPLLQWPLWGALYLVVQQASEAGGRFLWILDLSRPDRWLAILAGLLTGAGLVTGGGGAQPGAAWLALGLALFTSLLVGRLAAGVGLYWSASGLATLLQALLLRRTSPRPASRV